MARIKKIFCFAVIVSVVLTSTIITPSAVSNQEKLQQQYDKLEQQIESNRSKMDALKNDINKQKEYIKTLNAQNTAIQQQLEVLHSQIADKTAEKESLQNQIKSIDKKIEDLTAEISNLQVEIEKTYDLLKKRMRAAYISGNGSQIELLFNSENVETLLVRAELLISIARHDNELVDDLVSKIEKIEKDQSELETQKQNLTDQKQTLEKTMTELEKNVNSLNEKEAQIISSMENTNNIISSLDKSSEAYSLLMNNLEAERDRIDRELQKEIEALPPTVTPPNGGNGSSTNNKYLQWPVPGYNRISSEFGPRDKFGYKYHYGMDITGGNIYGKKIVAAESGTVVKSTVDSAFGYYILINHGNGKLTRYAHCSKLIVKEGQYVTRGQKIAEVGSTGNSTGPHLHFEVYINNKRENPRKHLNPADF